MSTLNQNKQAYIAVINQAIQSIDHGKTLRKDRFKAMDDMAYTWELLMQTLRWYPRYEWVLTQLLHKPIKEKYRPLQMLLVVAFVRLDCLSEANHHVVNHTVELAKGLGYGWASAMVNQVLRAFLRQQDSLHQSFETNDVLRFAQPQWVISSFKKRWPTHFEAILASLHQKPRHWVNCYREIDKQTLKRALKDHIETVALGGEDFTCLSGLNVKSLLEQTQGSALYIQDLGAQMLSFFLRNLTGVGSALDACAAPGGKSFILLKHFPAVKLTCADIGEERQAKLIENLTSIHHDHPICFWLKDALMPLPKCYQLAYDLVLLDAPCSGSGVMKRHPEKKYQPWRLGPLVETQKKLLCELWQGVSPGGYLVYSTCSILPEENEKVIGAFLDDHADDAEPVEVELPIGFKRKFGWQILPSELSDGHYFVLIKKLSVI